MRNPYENVNWNTNHRVQSVSHSHMPQASAQHGVSDIDLFWHNYNQGQRHFAISNYRPSLPNRYPVQDFWPDAPNDVIACPNAEHWQSNLWNLHFNPIGSLIDDQKEDVPMHWTEYFTKAIEQMTPYDGKGIITINHPIEYGLTKQQICEMLDYHPQVNTLEIYNELFEIVYGNGWALDLWDSILVTGRQCYGTAVPDDVMRGYPEPYRGELFAEWEGRIILLVDEKTEIGCIDAYVNGTSYAKVKNTDLHFTSIIENNNLIEVATQNAEKVRAISYGLNGIKRVNELPGNNINFRPQHDTIFVRFEAEGLSDMIFSQPIMFKNKEEIAIGKKQDKIKKTLAIFD